ncbi:MAG: class I SAM-dependent methyltransferase [Gemmatimonadetes bacterium]|nr:class I SAM-dependent methyltransferase [Gemmatimonadota bacterium]MYK53310.1 class I SAM-dependent methyltransferase [Gemmatimonadota bacterium]
MLMPNPCDQKALLAEQYEDAGNLGARIALHDRFSTNRHGWHRWVFDQLRVPSRSKILELGCGSGSLWAKNADRIPGDWTIILSDLYAGMIKQAKAILSHSRISFAFGQIDAQFIAIADETVDVVIANHMLYHVPDRPKAYSEIYRILRPNGQLYAAANGITASAGIPDLVKQIKPDAYDDIPGSTSSFGLKTGASELSIWFADIEVLNYKDSLLITEVEPLVDYVKSTQRLNEAELGEFRVLVQAEISRNSEICIPKNAGLFKASKVL